MTKLSNKSLRKLLLDTDSPNKYEPVHISSDSKNEIEVLVSRLEKAISTNLRYESPDTFQDGSLLTVIQSKTSDDQNCPDGIYISSFGKLSTILETGNVMPFNDKEIVIHTLCTLGYLFVDYVTLDKIEYDGEYEQFFGMKWSERYFSPWFKNK